MTHGTCPDDYHCGRPENVEPYVIAGTPIELYSSEMDAGRWRHWGGSDQWLCREHPYHVNAAPRDGVEDKRRYRTMEVTEAAEHAVLHRHDLAEEARELEVPLQEAELMVFEAQHAGRLEALDRAAPDGGHAGRQAIDQRKEASLADPHRTQRADAERDAVQQNQQLNAATPVASRRLWRGVRARVRVFRKR